MAPFEPVIVFVFRIIFVMHLLGQFLTAKLLAAYVY